MKSDDAMGDRPKAPEPAPLREALTDERSEYEFRAWADLTEHESDSYDLRDAFKAGFARAALATKGTPERADGAEAPRHRERTVHPDSPFAREHAKAVAEPPDHNEFWRDVARRQAAIDAGAPPVAVVPAPSPDLIEIHRIATQQGRPSLAIASLAQIAVICQRALARPAEPVPVVPATLRDLLNLLRQSDGLTARDWNDPHRRQEMFRLVALVEDALTARPAEQDTAPTQTPVVSSDRASAERPEAVVRRVVCAAIRAADGDLLLGIRHYSTDMHKQMAARRDGEKFAHRHDDDQGFVDQWGVYMNRGEAFDVAMRAGQDVNTDHCGKALGGGFKLYSEGLY